MSAAGHRLLEREQRSLLTSLVGSRNSDGLMPLLAKDVPAPMLRRGLRAYQANGMALAERVLGAAYPVIAELLGAENFPSLARYFWQREPPKRGDLACWGEGFAAFLDAEAQLAGEPYLGDVARIEWALHGAAGAADNTANLSTLAWLSGEGSADVTLTLAAGVYLLASVYPVVSLVNAHLHGEPAQAVAAERLRTGVREHALVWRHGFKPRLRCITAAEYALVEGLLADRPVEAALQKAVSPAHAVAFHFGDWLAWSVRDGLVIGAHFLSNNNEREQRL